MHIKRVKKRDGSIVEFDKSKIRDAIQKAAQAAGSEAANQADQLANKVTSDLKEIYGGEELVEEEFPEVEDIQDTVEKVLIEEGHYSTAKRYILYRQEHRQKRREKAKLLDKAQIGKIGKKFSLRALRVLASRYLLRDTEGKIVESPEGLFQRVATNVTIPDLLRDDRVFTTSGGNAPPSSAKSYLDSFQDYDCSYSFAGQDINQWTFKAMAELYRELASNDQMKVDFPQILKLLEEGYFDQYEENWRTYFELMVEQKFLPNSPTLMNAGTRLGQLSACFVLPMEDDMGRIMDASKDAALIFQSGGGVGINYSELRPEGDLVASTSGVASGPISFMRIIDTVTDVVKQGGKRRGANMGILNISHPDIKEFIKVKQKEGKLENFNISVGTTKSFWEALTEKEKAQFDLVNPRTKNVVTQVKPKALLELISHSAWESADPGMIFFDRVNQFNVLEPAKGKIEGTNPCGEQPLYSYESCNLGSINLHNHLNENGFAWDEYEKTIRVATRFLDNVLDMNNFPLDNIEESTKQSRKIGLGVMGLSDLLYDTGIKYNSREGYETMGEIAETLTYFSMDESANLAQERGSFPLFDESEYPEGKIPVAGYYEKENYQRDWDSLIDKIKRQGIRNGMTTTIAPTGSISMIADTSHGIEPEFSLAYEKNVTAGDFYYANNVFEETLKERGMYSDQLLEKVNRNYGSLCGLEEIPSDLKEIFVTALDIHYTDHLMAQACWQDWITASISKTINMPNNSTPDEVFNSFLLAHKLGLKGLTVYRDGSKSQQVLNMKKEKSQERSLEPSNYIKSELKDHLNEFEEDNKLLDSLNLGSSVQAGSNKSRKKKAIPENDQIKQVDQLDSIEQCPDCGGQIIYEAGCNKCVECGWGLCSI